MSTLTPLLEQQKSSTAGTSSSLSIDTYLTSKLQRLMMAGMIQLRSTVVLLVVFGAVMQKQLSSAVPLTAAARVLLEVNIGVGVGGVGVAAKAGAGGVGVGANAKAGGKPFKHKKTGGKGASPAPPPSAVDCGDNSDPCVGGGGGGNGGGYYDYAAYP